MLQAYFEAKKNKPANKTANKMVVKYPKQIIPKTNGKPDLNKRWFIIYSFINPETKKSKRFYEYGDVSQHKTINARKKALSELCAARTILIKAGWNPFEKFNPALNFFEENNLPKTGYVVFEYLLTEKLTKQKNIRNLKSRGQIFLKWLSSQKLTKVPITEINYSICSKFINDLQVSPRTKNNYIVDLRTIFEFGIKTEIIKHNPFKGIEFFKTTPARHEVFTEKELTQLSTYLKNNNSILYSFIRFFTYCYLRPLTITKLQVKHFNLAEATIKITPEIEKNEKEYYVLIPNILKADFEALKLHQYLNNYYVFTMRGVSKQASWRDSFTAEFKKAKTTVGITNQNKTMYGYRHTITKNIYLNLRKKMNKQEAINALITITRHKTVKALEKYLRQIGADVPDDYSDLITIDI